ncbi:MAG: DUF6268 family outer membrane beta-barrel protein [Fibrobacterales bacterium]
MKKLLLNTPKLCSYSLSILLTVVSSLYAFENNLAHISYTYSPPISYSIQSADTVNRELTYQLHSIKAGVTIPIQVNKQFVLMASPLYKGLYFTHDNSASSESTRNFHSMELGIKGIWLKDDTWTFALAVLPSLVSDFESGVSNRVWQTNGSAVAIRRSAKQALMFGLIYTRATGSPMLLPLLGYHKKWNALRFSAVLPSYVTLNYSLPNKLRMGLRAELVGDHIQFDAKAANNIEVKFSRLQVGPEVIVPIKGLFFMKMHGGYSMYMRDIEFKNQGQLVATAEHSPNLFLKAGIVMKFPKRKQKSTKQASPSNRGTQ